MHLPVRDQVATLLVAIGLLLYIGWALGLDVPIVSSAAAAAVAILVLGMLASASAVVPAFAALLHGSRAYLVVTTVLGLVAFGAGVWTLISGEPITLAVLTVSTVALWALSTYRHVALAGPAVPAPR